VSGALDDDQLESRSAIEAPERAEEVLEALVAVLWVADEDQAARLRWHRWQPPERLAVDAVPDDGDASLRQPERTRD
jgi:hypothetical protein